MKSALPKVLHENRGPVDGRSKSSWLPNRSRRRRCRLWLDIEPRWFELNWPNRLERSSRSKTLNSERHTRFDRSNPC